MMSRMVVIDMEDLLCAKYWIKQFILIISWQPYKEFIINPILYIKKDRHRKIK